MGAGGVPLPTTERQHNLSALLEYLTTFYQDELDSELFISVLCVLFVYHVGFLIVVLLPGTVLLELPIISAICRDPGSEAGLDGLRKFMLLVLGCAVKCESRERYINSIKLLDPALQIEMMEIIQTFLEEHVVGIHSEQLSVSGTPQPHPQYTHSCGYSCQTEFH